MKSRVAIVSGVRTAIGDFGGTLKSTPPTILAANCVREALARAGDPAVGHVVFGNVIHTEPKDMYLSRVAALNAGLPPETPCLTLNRLCGSGLQAVISAAQAILLGDCDTAVAGGAESMSRAPFSAPGFRWGQRLGDSAMVDMAVGALQDPFGHGHMGITAETIATRFGIGRKEQDAFAADSHARAVRAIAEGHFAEQILPVEVKADRQILAFTTDEHVRQVSLGELAALRPAFQKDGRITAGNASSLNDGAAALVLMDHALAERRGLEVLGHIVAYAHAGVEPEVMGLGPVPAVRSVLAKTGLSVDQFDIIESNEAFAAQALAVARELGFPAERTNPNGGAIALGHPIGATGAMLVVKTLYELKRIEGRYGLITMCIGGGQGIALVVER